MNKNKFHQVCPICGKLNSLASRVGGYDRCKCPQDTLDKFLEIGGAFDWIGPLIGLIGDIIDDKKT